MVIITAINIKKPVSAFPATQMQHCLRTNDDLSLLHNYIQGIFSVTRNARKQLMEAFVFLGSVLKKTNKKASHWINGAGLRG